MSDPHTWLGAPGRLARRGAARYLGLLRRGAVESRSVAHLARSGLLSPQPPQRLIALVRAYLHNGQLGALVATAAILHGDRPALVDERGTLSFAQLDARADALACAFLDRGVGAEDCVGILCRNHRGFLDVSFALGKLGARAIYLNTDFAGPQLRDVCRREGVTLVVCDEEYTDRLAGVEARHGHLVAWAQSPRPDALDALIHAAWGRRPPPAEGSGTVVLLTSGTTGVPKGAPRHAGASLHPLGALLSKVPYRTREATFVAAPMFHALAFSQTLLAVGLGCTIITHRRFDPERVLDTIEQRRPTGLVLVPVMLARIVAALERAPDRWDTASLRVVFLSGAQLEAELVRRAHRTIGEKLYNFYGSTEVAWVTFATPRDLRAAPGCAGRPPFGTTVRLFDPDGRPVEGAGRVGRIFVGHGFAFEGYTGGGDKERIDGLISTGDVGHFDAAGRLFIDGRDDDMIVSGGENVFPGEIEELLSTHEAVEEAAVIGVPDAEFGQRLAAFVVPAPGCRLEADEVKEFVAANLARYKVPRDVTLVDELPRNPAGKVLKRQLAQAG